MNGNLADSEIGSLLAQEGFVRRLVRGILFDEHRIDDVVQQTWLAALEGPPRAARASRSWLGAVARNLSFHVVRGEERRRRREATAAVAESQPSVDEMVAREALRQEVVAALVGLPEPYRTTLVLRYYDDLRPKEIAQRTGVPSATARTRLRRGLELVREHFDRQHGDRRTWCIGLVELVRAERAAVSLGAPTGVIGGSSALNGLAVVAACAALFLAVGIAWLVSARSGEVDPPGSATVLVDPRAAAVATPVAQAGTEAGGIRRGADVVVAEEPVPGLSGFRGRVVVAGGVPVVGAVVRVAGIDGVSFFDGSAPAGLDVVGGQARTGADGVFVVAELRPRAVYALSVRSDERGVVFRALEDTPASGEVVDLGDIELEEQGIVEGMVAGPDGEPLAGVVLWAADLPAPVLAAVPVERLDPRGGAMLLLPAPVASELERPQDFALRLRAFLGSKLLCRFDLVADEWHAVHVVDAPRWVAEAWDVLPIARTSSRADGSFRLTGVTPGVNVLVARGAGLRTGTLQVMVRAGQVRNAGVVKLAPGEQAAGTVVDAAGAPVAGAEVRVAAPGALGFCGLAFCEPAVRTDGVGRFRVGGLPRGRVLVAARRSAAHGWQVSGPLDPDDELAVRLPPAAALALRLTSRSGRPVAGARLALLAGPFLGELARAGLQQRVPLEGRVRELGDGRYRIEDLAPGSYTLRVEAPGHAFHAVMVGAPREQELEVVLEPAATFRVLVLGPGGEPLAGAKVFVQRAETPAWARPIMPTKYGLPAWTSLPHVAGHTDRAGTLEVAVLPAGRAHVSVAHVAFGQAARTVELPLEVVRVELQAPAAIEGILSDRGAPVPAAGHRVVVTRSDDLPTGMPWPLVQTVVGPGGAFRVGGLMPGKIKVSAKPVKQDARSMTGLVELVREGVIGSLGAPIDFRSAIREELVLAAGEVRRLDFDLGPGQAPRGEPAGTIAGSVVVDGAPVRGVQLIRAVLFVADVLATTDASGSFRIENVAAGPHDLLLVDPRSGVQLWAAPVVVAAGAEQRIDLRLRTGVLRGRAAFPGGRAAAGLTVNAQGKAPGSRGVTTELETTTDQAGGFVLTGLPEGVYLVTLRSETAEGAASGAVVAPGDANPEVEVTARPLVSVTGRVELGRDLPADLVVVLRAVDEEASRSSFAGVGKSGDFSAGHLRPGPYRVQLAGKDYLRQASPSELEVPETGLSGIVLGEGGKVAESR